MAERPRPSGTADGVVAAHVARGVLRPAVVWGAVFGLVVFSSLTGFTTAYPSVASRRRLALAIEGNVGFRALFGTARRVDTAAGFTAWRTMGSLALVAAVWGLLSATRQLRGEEEAGRWEVVLAGTTTRVRATAAAVAGLLAGYVVLWGTTAVLVVATSRRSDAGFSVGASLFFALALAAPAALFGAVGALCSQLAATRRQAATIAGAVFGVSFLLRLVGDTERSLDWVHWLTPLGWVEELRPLTGSHPWPLVPIAGFVVAAVAASVWLAGRRDLGASILRDRDVAEPEVGLLQGPLGLAARLARPTAVGWTAGVAATAFIVGLVAKGAGDAVGDSDFMAQALARMGGQGNGPRLYLGLAFLVITAMASLVAAGQVVAARDEEAEGRLDHLLARPVGRAAWLAGRMLVTVVVLVVVGVVAGAAAWLGAASQGAGIGFGSLLLAGLNAVPGAVVILGAGVLAHGIAPRATSAVVYGLVAWSFLVELIGSMVVKNHLFLDLSVFHHAPPVPAADFRWSSAAILVLVGAAAAAAGTARLARRDLAGA